MNDFEFLAGKLDYEVLQNISHQDLSRRLAGDWRDGFVAFSQKEVRHRDQGFTFDTPFLSERINGKIPEAEGYVMEINLWRSNGTVVEEIAAEREDDTWYVQSWKLETDPEPHEDNCWFRPSEATRAGSHHKHGNRLFAETKTLDTIEVVWPEKRLNFYLTRG